MALLKSESYRKGAVSSTLLNVIAKGIGFINSLLIIYIFGSGFETDLYFLILSTVTLVTSFINGIDSLVLIPEAMRLRINEGPEREKKFLNFFIRLYTGIGLVIAAFILLLPVLFYSFFSEFSKTALENKNAVLMLSAVLFPVQLLNSLFISILASHKYFTIPMLTALVNSIISITVLVILRDSLSITGAAIAVLSGYIINFCWLFLYLRKELQWNFFSKVQRPSGTVVRNIFLMELNILPVLLRNYITVFLLTGLGAGVMTAYNYGQQISLLPHALLATQIVTVAGIKFNELSSKNQREDLDAMLNGFLKLLYIILLPLAAIMSLTSGEAASFIFGYSKKIQPDTINNISLVIFFMALTLPNLAMDLTLSRLLMAQQKIKEGLPYALITHFVFFVLVFAGISFFGLKGFLWAYFTGNNIFLPVLYYFLLKKTIPFIQYTKWIKSSLPFIFFNIVLIAVFLIVKEQLPLQAPALVVITVTATLYITAVVLFNKMFNYYRPINELLAKLFVTK
jgi:putative peptidoglycan lipid II flippase